MNNPRKEALLPVTNSGPKPGDFGLDDLGSIRSKAAARLLAEKRKAALIPVLRIQITNAVDIASDYEVAEQGTTNAGGASNSPSLCPELDPMSMGNAPVHWMTRRELDAKQHEYYEYMAKWQVQSDTHRTAATSPEAPSVPLQEQIATLAAPPKPEPESSVEQHWNDYLVHEERVPEPKPRRRPIARKPPYRRWPWWPPSAFGL